MGENVTIQTVSSLLKAYFPTLAVSMLCFRDVLYDRQNIKVIAAFIWKNTCMWSLYIVYFIYYLQFV